MEPMVQHDSASGALDAADGRPADTSALEGPQQLNYQEASCLSFHDSVAWRTWLRPTRSISAP